MFNNTQLRSYVIKPALLPLDLWAPETEDLLVERKEICNPAKAIVKISMIE